MTALEWDKIGDRVYQIGVDRGVLYTLDGSAVAWNGITGVEDGYNSELKSFYMDGVKVLDRISPGEFVGKLTAFTYPDELDALVGLTSDIPGLTYYEQPPKPFNLSYRTLIGNDVDGPDHGYKIHLFYNLMAIPDSHTTQSIQGDVEPEAFSWSLTGTPVRIGTARPTSHISISSLDTDPAVLSGIEDILYGTDTTNPRMPSIAEIKSIFGTFGILFIIDNGDGTWTASDPGNAYISMDDPTTFRIFNADATYLDASTYTITDTYPD